MDRILVLLASGAMSGGIYLGFVMALKNRETRDYFKKNWWLSPNWVCVWRTIIGLIALVIYFSTSLEFLGIMLFTLSAVLDGVDGLIARKCKKITEFGKILDPLCDKLTYLPALAMFALVGKIEVAMVVILVIIEFFGQFIVRPIIKNKSHLSVAANKVGKFKAALCFILIIYLAILDGGIKMPNIADETLMACNFLAMGSIIFKFIPRKI